MGGGWIQRKWCWWILTTIRDCHQQRSIIKTPLWQKALHQRIPNTTSLPKQEQPPKEPTTTTIIHIHNSPSTTLKPIKPSFPVYRTLPTPTSIRISSNFIDQKSPKHYSHQQTPWYKTKRYFINSKSYKWKRSCLSIRLEGHHRIHRLQWRVCNPKLIIFHKGKKVMSVTTSNKPMLMWSRVWIKIQGLKSCHIIIIKPQHPNTHYQA